MSSLPTASNIAEVLPGVFRWEAYSPAHKVELTSHAIVRDGRLFIFDPIPLADADRKSLLEQGKPAAIILTNANHERAALEWQQSLQVPICASSSAKLELPAVERISPTQTEWQGWRLHHLAGGAGGEIAFRWPERSLVLLGDAVVNLPTRRLELLPYKYCENPAALRTSLRALGAEPFSNLLMAHGVPLTGDASTRLAGLW